MPRFITLLALIIALAAATTTSAADEKPTVAQLAWLAGHWRGPLADGRVAEEICSAPEGGVMTSMGREFAKGKCVFFDLVVFAEKDGAVILIPHPSGKRSPHTFPLVTLDLTAKRAVFENKEHDFPKSFTYELVAPDRLRITLTGEIKGQPTTEVYDLPRVK